MKWFVLGLLAVSFLNLCYVSVEMYRAERLRGGR